MTESCLFCEIASKQQTAHIVYEDDDLIAFVDKAPIRRGHLQILPKIHYAYFDDLPPDLAGRIVVLGQSLARCLKQIYKVQRVGFVFTGNDIQHAHAHVIPLHHPTDITSRRYISEDQVTFVDRPELTDREMSDIASDVAKALVLL